MNETAPGENDLNLREHLTYLLRGGGAHLSLEDFLNDFPPDRCDRRIDGLPYTAWQILEHMRIAQWDILEFSRDGRHESPDFPGGYWPQADELGDAKRWKSTADQLQSDLQEMIAMVLDRKTDLFAKIPHGDGQTVLREALLIADHNAYHLGALAVIRRLVKDS